jgi:hypothetical protein
MKQVLLYYIQFNFTQKTNTKKIEMVFQRSSTGATDNLQTETTCQYNDNHSSSSK